jgi:hypothetical protein
MFEMQNDGTWLQGHSGFFLSILQSALTSSIFHLTAKDLCQKWTSRISLSHAAIFGVLFCQSCERNTTQRRHYIILWVYDGKFTL